MHYRGRIISEKSATCGECEFYFAGLMNDAASELRREGWRLTRAKGWLCPECAAALDRGETDG